MRNSKLIFSDSLSSRISRHILFWTTRFLLIFFFNFCASMLIHVLVPDADVKYKWFLSYQTGMFRVLLDVAYCYTVTYWLIPRFLTRKKYGRFALLLFAFTTISFIADFVFLIGFFQLMNQTSEKFYQALWYEAGAFINSGPPVVCVFFLAVKMLRKWYLEQEEKIAITRENTNAELQLLKAQMHPHFLFNTLNNIYSFTLANHPSAANLVTKLSDLMDYINSEGEKDRVLVEKEIQLIRDYISLEKVRYGDRLEIKMEITGDTAGKFIAPLLMIPFVENAFKHGASVMRGKQWMKLNIIVKEHELCFEMSNSKPLQTISQNGKKGIGLANVQKRLQLIYPGRHVLKIESTDTVYAIHLEIALESQPSISAGNQSIQQPQSFSYA